MQWHLYGEPQQLNRVLESSKGSISFVTYTSSKQHLLIKNADSTLATDLNQFLKKAHILVLSIRNQNELFYILSKWKKYHIQGAKLILLEGKQIGLGDKVNYFLNQSHSSFEVVSLYIKKVSKNSFRIILGGEQGSLLDDVRIEFGKLHHTIFLVKRMEAEYITQWHFLKQMMNRAFSLQLEKELSEQGLDIEVVKKGLTIYQSKKRSRTRKISIRGLPYAISSHNKMVYFALNTLYNEQNWLTRQIKQVKEVIPLKVIAVWGNNNHFRDILKLPYHIQWYQTSKTLNRKTIISDNVVTAKNPYDSVRNADLLIILNSDDQFASIHLDKMEQLMNYKIIIDTNNIFDLNEMSALNWHYISKGRKPVVRQPVR